MLSVDEAGEEFFDSVDYLTSEESFVVEESLGYDIWLNEPQSVKKRRTEFLHRMGLAEIERMTECSGAVSGSSSIVVDETLSGIGREFDGEANCMVYEFGDDCNQSFCSYTESETAEHSLPAEINNAKHLHNSAIKHQGAAAANSSDQKYIHVCEREKVNMSKKKMTRWWKQLTSHIRSERRYASDVPKESAKAGRVTRVEVQQNKKQFKELTGVFAGQKISAHKGIIWSMKFSTDGKFLATGGEDGVVRIWRVKLTDCPHNATYCNYDGLKNDGKLRCRMKQSGHAAIVFPEKVLHIEESPLQEFHGHSSDVLDLAWSSSNLLLSSSKDSTVRLWQIGSDQCIDVFKHINYVTCIQFNPVDENYFISGSIDGKVRIWGVQEKRVVNWADVHDIVTALCYQPNAKGFAVGSVSGTCRFYEALGSELSLNREYQIHGRKKTTGNRITGIQFVERHPQKVMITSEDSKIRLLDGVEVVQKYKGLAKSGSQMSASFASTGDHIVSVGDDSRIYIWNYDEMQIHSSRQVRSARSCEHFISDAVSVAIPWLGGTGAEQSDRIKVCSCLQNPDHREAPLPSRDSVRFSLSNWFSMDVSSRGSVTWPEEKLPVLELPSSEENSYGSHDNGYSGNHCHLHQHLQHDEDWKCNGKSLSTTWGLAIVAAGWDGTISTFQNFGLPIRT